MCIRPTRWIGAALIGFAFAAAAWAPAPAEATEVFGELKRWHAVELQFAGPEHAETDSSPNPFLDYRLQCRFTGPSGQLFDVPGFFDADGAGGDAGDLWVCRFSPNEVGTWRYRVSFREGSQVAVSLDAAAGNAVAFDGELGAFEVSASDKTGLDFRRGDRGRLRNIGRSYLTFEGSGAPWVKGAANVPENLLGYTGFDETPLAGHDFASHVADWNPGDPDWNDGAGRALIGTINYLSSTGANGFYFLPMNVGGDANDTYPTVAPQDKTHYDTSKLRQWDTVFAHAQSKGVFMHFQLAETEPANENYHDGGQLGVERKLYYRELVARFGHHLGLEWDLGEENDYGSARRRAFAAHLKAIDAYDHPVTTHIHTNQMEIFYRPLLGNEDFDMTAFQIDEGGFANGDAVMSYRQRSIDAGVPWVVSIDEPQKIENDPDDQANGYPHGRTAFLWPTYMSGGGGFEWYVQSDGGGHGFDQAVNDWREMDVALVWTGHALRFLDTLPLLEMEPKPALGRSSMGGRTFVLAKPGETYALYHPSGGRLELDLRNLDGRFAVRWYDPRSGTWTSGGSVIGGDWADLGAAPFAGDVAALVERTGEGGVPPRAAFEASPGEGEAPVTVRFDASASSDDGEIVAYAWSFGDGAQGTGPSPTHVYRDPGVYVVKLVVTDDSGLDAAQTGEVVALEPAPEPDPDRPKILLGDCPDRGSPRLLAGETVAGPMCVFVEPGGGVAIALFYLDDPESRSRPRHSVRLPPLDFVGHGPGGVALPFDTTTLENGPHRIDVKLGYYANRAPELVSATFDVENASPGGTPPPRETDDATPATGLEMLVSESADRSRPHALMGRLVSGEIYAWLDYAGHVDQVRYWIDDPTRSGPPHQIEHAPYHDLAGGNLLAGAFDTRALANGRHQLHAEVDHPGGTQVVFTRFRVYNDAELAFGAPPETDHPILSSGWPDRRNAEPLFGQTVSGVIHPFVGADAGVNRVRFWLDDPERSNAPRQTESIGPFDFAGGSVEASNGFDTTSLPEGVHRIDAEIDRADGSNEHSWAIFEVAR
jgi:PKD repeat protein